MALGVLPWALLILALVAAGAFAYLWASEKAEDARADAVKGDAREFVTALTNFSSQTIASDVAEIRRWATGGFAQEVDELFSEDVIAAIETADASSEAAIESIFVESIDEDNASVFAVLSETVRNKSLAAPRSDTVRMEIGMVRAGDAWKVNEVKLIQSPGTLVPSS